jgi:hypothetical protein
MLLRLASRLLPRSWRERSQALAHIAQAASEIAALTSCLLQASRAGAQQSTAQHTRILEVLAMEERIRAFAEKNGVHCRDTAARIESVARDTDLGSQMVATTTQHMQEMAQTVSLSAALMRQFVDRVSEVDVMVSTIGDIARQTNLLALNAAIEAANAGHKGDGFSVIAHEIRVLADRTTQSTTEIGNRIEVMSFAARDAEAAMQKGQAAVQASIEQSLDVQASIQSLRDAMQQVKGMSADVAIGSDRQIVSVNQVTESIQQIDDLAASCAHEADASAEMSMMLVNCTRGLQDSLASLGSSAALPQTEADIEEQESAAEFLRKINQCAPRVDQAIQAIVLRTTQSGPGSLEASSSPGTLPVLRFGTADAANAKGWLQEIREATGCNATIFALAGEQFLRVATNVSRGDGTRAIGTALNPRGIAAQKLLSGKSHYGTAYVLGAPFLTAYEPVFSANGQLIGALYAGYPLD